MDQAGRGSGGGELSVVPTLEARPGKATAPRSRARLRFNQGMRVIRRVHLYAGLFMVPWVFLYGISALLFNHPDAFADAPSVAFTADEARSTALGSIPRAEDLAEQVVAALNRKQEAGKEGAPGYRLIESAGAEFSRDLAATVKGDGKEYSVRINLEDGSGTVRPVVKKANKPAPFVSKAGLKLDPPPFEGATRGLPDLLGKLGYTARDVTIRNVPDLSFAMLGPQNETWRVTYNAGTNQVSGRRDDVPGIAPTLRRELTLLHLAHGFPRQTNARWVWAIFVDLMFVSMVGWGATGLAMWWQMKNVRKIGAVVLVFSVITAALLAIAMHAQIVAEGVS